MKIEYLVAGSPDCPLIRIYGNDETGMRHLRSAIGDLISGERGTIDLHRLPAFAAVGGCTLKLTTASAVHHEGLRQQVGTLDFEWALPITEWETVADLIEPFVTQSETPGFQWLHDRTGEIAILLSSYEGGQW